jgi:hypothetical protein
MANPLFFGSAPTGMPTSAPAAPTAAPSRAQRSFNEINSEIPLAQWQAWDQFVDSSCPETHPYRSQKVGANGQKVNTCEETPDNCPHGTTAFGANQCIPISDPRIQAAWGGQGGAQGGQGGQGQAGAMGAAQPTEPSRPLTLQDALMNSFKAREGAFGMTDGRTPMGSQFQGAFGVDQYGKPLPNAPNLTGRGLSGGGILWSDDGADLSQFGAGAGKPQGARPRPASPLQGAMMQQAQPAATSGAYQPMTMPTPNIAAPAQQSTWFSRTVYKGKAQNAPITFNPQPQQPQSPLAGAMASQTPQQAPMRAPIPGVANGTIGPGVPGYGPLAAGMMQQQPQPPQKPRAGMPIPPTDYLSRSNQFGAFR